ncbi:hypothetical protein KW782_03170 [Candidatus Parcubacteria bacterium]|nr:hypothetical protein [Candidatus Parcubacteria bacterium]
MIHLFRWRKRGNGDRVATIEDTRSILGKDWICEAEDVLDSRKRKRQSARPPGLLVSYIERCAYQNKKRLADWYLLYGTGNSIEQLHVDPETSHYFFGQPLVWRTLSIWDPLNDQRWLCEKAEPQYWLINMRPLFRNMSIDRQQREIIGLGSEYERVPEHIFVDAAFTIFRLKNRRMFEFNFHQGPVARLGWFGSNGMMIMDPSLPVLCRKDTGSSIFINPSKQVL